MTVVTNFAVPKNFVVYYKAKKMLMPGKNTNFATIKHIINYQTINCDYDIINLM